MSSSSSSFVSLLPFLLSLYYGRGMRGYQSISFVLFPRAKVLPIGSSASLGFFSRAIWGRMESLCIGNHIRADKRRRRGNGYTPTGSLTAVWRLPILVFVCEDKKRTPFVGCLLPYIRCIELKWAKYVPLTFKLPCSCICDDVATDHSDIVTVDMSIWVYGNHGNCLLSVGIGYYDS
ncbi:hypothetical protein F5Y00DRAFT_38886 [Daldinia vernicosa]|uniref:uncharacterized protein n=1 Tax=Daldinia vernicosa TaxID=114800 RepID=UPI0020074189|nr:uncharacterized protein F5Y00DRAFT_38886 [Daldinia vernicosa]KAI0850046.1 hypothetical protein F5Y00DRAFT_38886 [Daldinia vernicosa]